MEQLLSEIEAFLNDHVELSEWQFGEMAMGDRRFVRELREGREVRQRTIARARAWMAEYRPKLAAA